LLRQIKLNEVEGGDFIMSEEKKELDIISDRELSLGVKAYGMEDYPTAFAYFLKSAEMGHDNAQYNLGLMYRAGKGVEKDLQKSAYWYKKAAEQGEAKARFELGRMYEYGQGVDKNIKKALYWYGQAAKQGYLEAQTTLASLYHYGYNMESDFEKAFYWYEQAARSGDRFAPFSLAEAFDRGVLIPQDIEKAVFWYFKSREFMPEHLKRNTRLEELEAEYPGEYARGKARYLEELKPGESTISV